MVVALVMLLGLSPGFALAADEPDAKGVWTDYAAAEAPAIKTYRGRTCYAIGTAEELAWFAKEVQDGRHLDANIVLTADIDLAAHKWTPIYHYEGGAVEDLVCLQSDYAGSVYGDYYTISNLELAPLVVEYIHEDASEGYGVGDIDHAEQYGFALTTGTVQDIRFDGVRSTIETAGKGDIGDNVGKKDVIYDVHSLALISVGALALNVEIAKPEISSVTGEYEYIFLITGLEGAKIYGTYVHAGSVKTTGDGTTTLIDAYEKLVEKSVINVTFNSEEEKLSGVWGTNGMSGSKECYTSIELFESDKLGEKKEDSWFTPENIYEVLGVASPAWSISDGELIFGKADRFAYDPWTDYAAEEAPKIVTYNGKECYAIGTAEELAWFAREVQNASVTLEHPEKPGIEGAITAKDDILSANVVLTADIDLGTHDWTPIYRHTGARFSWVEWQTAYSGDFYGDCHTVSGLYLAPLDVDYVYPVDSTSKFMHYKTGDIEHNEEYGFVVTTGTVQDIKFDGVYLDVSDGGAGELRKFSGMYTFIYDVKNLLLINGDTAVTDIEIANVEISVKTGEADYIQLVGIDDDGVVAGVYIHDGTITDSGDGTTWLIDAYFKKVRNTVVYLDEFEVGNEDYSGIWAEDPEGDEQPKLTDCYTNIDYEARKLCDYQVGNTMNKGWFTAENVYDAMTNDRDTTAWSLYKDVLMLDGKGVKSEVRQESYRFGDVNEDGEIDLLDFTLLRNYLAEGYTVEDHPSADVDGDREINIKDVLLLWEMLTAQG